MSPLTNDRFELLDRPAYVTELCRRLDGFGRGDRATIACMTYDPTNAAMAELTDAMCAAASRGARVRFIIDAINFMTRDTGGLGPLFWHHTLVSEKLPSLYRPAYDALARLREAGAQADYINPPARRFSNPLAGRSHLKFAVLNDRVYIGGSNLDYVDHTDIMAAFSHPPTAKWLSAIATDILRERSVLKALGDVDLQRDIDDETSIFIDTGLKRQSIIQEQAMQQIDQAEQYVYMTCQFFPSASTTAHLRQALERGVDVKLVFNDVRNNTRLPLIHLANLTWQRYRVPPVLLQYKLPRNHPYLHAKLLATEKSVIVGSHNYVTPGVRLGTAEMALQRRNPAFSRRVRTWFEPLVA